MDEHDAFEPGEFVYRSIHEEKKETRLFSGLMEGAKHPPATRPFQRRIDMVPFLP